MSLLKMYALRYTSVTSSLTSSQFTSQCPERDMATATSIHKYTIYTSNISSEPHPAESPLLQLITHGIVFSIQSQAAMAHKMAVGTE